MRVKGTQMIGRLSCYSFILDIKHHSYQIIGGFDLEEAYIRLAGGGGGNLDGILDVLWVEVIEFEIRQTH